jgi:hypothetical protein
MVVVLLLPFFSGGGGWWMCNVALATGSVCVVQEEDALHSCHGDIYFAPGNYKYLYLIDVG